MNIRVIVSALVMALLAAMSVAAERSPQPVEIDWLKQTALPFATSEAGNGFDDLQSLRTVIGGARIVALGEATHGTREFFQMKHRLTEFLATEMGFTIFSIEASTPEAYEVNEYAMYGRGNPKQLIGGMYFWTWNTEEVLDMLEWMWGFNQSGVGSIAFTGFDMQTPDVAIENVTNFLRIVDADNASAVASQYSYIKDSRSSGSSFGVTTYRFPIEAARGKHVKYRGFVKTEDLKNGWAGLWWRVDGENRKVLAFDNMLQRGPKGTTEWTEYELELDVAAEAVNVNFGVLMPGTGAAWFDGLTIELDGVLYDEMDFDLDFEGDRILGYASNDNGYLAELDPVQARSGKKSLKLISRKDTDDGPSAEEASEAAGKIFDDMDAARDRYVNATSAKEYDWALHNARIVHQSLRARAGNYGLVRDQSMAENVAWILEQNPDAKIILWAHNGHIARHEGAMGSHLADMFGDDYLPIGFAARDGKYYAMGEGQVVHTLSEPPSGSVESFFVAANEPRLILDLREADGESDKSGWLTESRPLRSIGAMAMEQQFYPVVVSEAYDVLIYFEHTSAARQLDTSPGRPKKEDQQ